MASPAIRWTGEPIAVQADLPAFALALRRGLAGAFGVGGKVRLYVPGPASAFATVGSLCDPTSQRWLVGPPARTDPADRKPDTTYEDGMAYVGRVPRSGPAAYVVSAFSGPAQNRT